MNELNVPWKPFEQALTLFNNIYSLTTSNWYLHYELSERDATLTANHKQYEVKRDIWRVKSGFKPNVTASGTNTWFSSAKPDAHSDKKRKITLKVTEINQKRNNLMLK